MPARRKSQNKRRKSQNKGRKSQNKRGKSQTGRRRASSAPARRRSTRSQAQYWLFPSKEETWGENQFNNYGKDPKRRNVELDLNIKIPEDAWPKVRKVFVKPRSTILKKWGTTGSDRGDPNRKMIHKHYEPKIWGALGQYWVAKAQSGYIAYHDRLARDTDPGAVEMPEVTSVLRKSPPKKVIQKAAIEASEVPIQEWYWNEIRTNPK